MVHVCHAGSRGCKGGGQHVEESLGIDLF
jgi:hypothetical protein